MSSLLLILIAVCSFLFYGVVGQDKAPLLAPAIVIGLFAIAIKLLRDAWGMSVGGVGESAIRQPPTFNLQLPTSSLLWLIFLLWGALMVPDALMTYEAKVRMLFMGTVVGAYMVWGRELTAFKDNRIVLGWLIFVVMFLALYGMVIHFKSPDSVLWTTRYTDHYDGRLASTYICPNHFAHLMQMLLPFCLALLFIPQAGIYLKLMAAYSFFVMLPPMFLTESRAGWLGSIAGVGTVVCLMALRRSKKLFVFLVVLVPLISVLTLFAGWQYSEMFQRRMTPVVEFLQGQAEEGVGSEHPDFRPQTWMDTLDMISEKPVVGYGPASYRYAYPEFRKRYKGVRSLTGHPHNEYLELTAEFGLIGFVLFALAWIWGSVWVLVKSLKAEEARHAFMGFALLGAIAGTMVHSFFDFQMHIFPNAMIFALLAAMSVGALKSATRRGVKSEGGRRRAEDGRRRAEDGRRRAEDGRRRAEDGRRRTEGRNERVEVHGRMGVNERGAVASTGGAGLSHDVTSGVSDPGYNSDHDAQRPTPNAKRPILKLQTVLLWLLAVSYLLLALVSIPVLASGVANALADRNVEAQLQTPNTQLQTSKLYRMATTLSPDNWRAYRGEARLIQFERRHSLDLAEKHALAVQELELYEKALAHNPKDPESLIAAGRVMIFLSKAHRAEGIGSDIPKFNSKLQTSNPKLQTDGLQMLREACGYRKFNDQYWWILGVELRKRGKYEEALEAFRHMETIRRTQSSRKNIQWLERRLAETGGQKTEDRGPKIEDGGQKTEVGSQKADGGGQKDMAPDVQSVLEELGEGGETGDGSLDDLFRIMEKE